VSWDGEVFAYIRDLIDQDENMSETINLIVKHSKEHQNWRKNNGKKI